MNQATWRSPIVVLVCGTIVLLLSFGIRTSFGLFLQPVSDELGWGREGFAFAIALQVLVWGLAQPFAGAVADKYGSGRVIALCGALFAFGVYLLAQVSDPSVLAFSAV